MTTINETAYPQLKSNFSEQELIKNFTPTKKELLLVDKHTRTTTLETRLGFIITLKCYQCLGRPIDISKVPKVIITYIAKAINVNIKYLRKYGQSLSRKRHIKIIRDYLKLNTDENERRQCMKKIAIKSASIKTNLVDIINDILEELVKNCFEILAFDSILRIAKAARVLSNNYYYKMVSDSLSDNTKKVIDTLFSRDSENENSKWYELKKEPKNPTFKHVKTFIFHLNRLKELRAHINISMDLIPIRRVEDLIGEAMALDSSDMKRIKYQRRYCLAAILILFKTSSAIDDIAGIFIRWMRKLHNDGREDLER